MGSHSKQISIIIRAYNCEKYISKCISSALNQTFNKELYEVIIINDGSTDNTRKIIESFNDERLVIVNQENKGMIESGYIGIENTSGEYITFLDGDDELKKEYLSELFDSLKNNEDLGFAYCDYYEINLNDGTEKIVFLDNIFNSLACGMLLKKDTINEIGFWKKNMIFPEYDFLIRLMKKYKGIHVKKPLYMYNRHDDSYTGDKERVERGKKELFERYGEIKGLREY